MKSEFVLEVHPQETTASYLKKTVEWCNEKKPEFQTETQGDNTILFVTPEGFDERLVISFLNHLVLKFAKEQGVTPEIPL